jgi:16S rRNA (cytosine1402-N4)-methyltransferase
MRMDLRQTVTAEQLVNQLSAQQLGKVFRDYGEEGQARRIAAAIVERRERTPLRTTTELAQVIEQVKSRHGERIHPATRVFQALRIEVNQELASLESSLDRIVDLILPGGRLVVIAFHSLEDRIVKTIFRRSAGKCVCFRPRPLCKCPRAKKVELLTRRPMTSSDEELSRNPRSRSAKLRALERTIPSD